MFTAPLLIIPQIANDPKSHQQVSCEPPAEPRSSKNYCTLRKDLCRVHEARQGKSTFGIVPFISYS